MPTIWKTRQISWSWAVSLKQSNTAEASVLSLIPHTGQVQTPPHRSTHPTLPSHRLQMTKSASASKAKRYWLRWGEVKLGPVMSHPLSQPSFSSTNSLSPRRATLQLLYLLRQGLIGSKTVYLYRLPSRPALPSGATQNGGDGVGMRAHPHYSPPMPPRLLWTL